MEDLSHCLTHVRKMPITYPFRTPKRSPAGFVSEVILHLIAILAVAPLAIAIGIVEGLRAMNTPTWIIIPVGCMSGAVLVVAVPWLLFWAIASFFVKEILEFLEKKRYERARSHYWRQAIGQRLRWK